MKNTRLISFVLAAAVIGGFACKKKEAPPAAVTEPGGQTIAATVKTSRIAQGYARKSTYFKLPDISGGDIDLASHAGKPVLVMFFTETCPYCRKAAPFIEKVHLAYTKKGLNVVGICIQDDPEAPRGFARDLATTFSLAYKGRKIYKDYKAQGVPFIYLLDRNHEIHEMWGGYSPEYDAEIIAKVEEALTKPM